YGVYTGGRLAGVASMYLFGDEGADFSEIKMAAEGLKHNRSYGLIHFINQEIIPQHGYTNDGYRSLLHDSAIQKLLIDKLHFERAFTRLQVRYRPPVRTMIRASRLVAPILKKAAPRVGAVLLQDRIADDSNAELYDLFEFTASDPVPVEMPGMRLERMPLGSRPMHVYWRVLSRGKAACYRAITEDGAVAHTTYLLPKMPRLSFMAATDWQIGPAFTVEKFRGRGIYRWVIGQIVRDLQAKGEKGRVLMFAHNGNAASSRGILKAGFTRIGLIRKSGLARSYKLIASFL
ncbi:MAG: GNAT family N-acetyltransferase, partial [Rhizobiaceae bacterium]